MAKGLRSSAKKVNKAKLRRRIFEPAELSRKKRLSARLHEVASQPQKQAFNEAQSATRENESEDLVEERTNDAGGTEAVMDIERRDEASDLQTRAIRGRKWLKKGRTKNKAAMVFPALIKRREAEKIRARQRRR